jgi:hypothetical protein
LLHVFGLPGAVGALTAVGTASMLNPDTGLALGTLVAGVGTVLAGYFITAGFDRGLVKQLQDEKQAEGARLDDRKLQEAVWNAPVELRPLLERIVTVHASIEAVFHDGLDDAVERILEGSRPDLRALRDRALKLSELYRRLGDVIQQTDGHRLYAELNRLKAELAHMPPGPARAAQEEALASAERTYGQWHNALGQQKQVTNVLTVIEKNLEEFKLAMALRKAALVEGEEGATNVSELQERLTAAGQACDQLVGRSSVAPRRPNRARA